MIENHLDYITEFILNNKLIKDKTNESNIGYVFFELVGVEADEWEIEYIKNFTLQMINLLVVFYVETSLKHLHFYQL